MQSKQKRFVVALVALSLIMSLTWGQVQAADVPAVNLQADPTYQLFVRIISYVKAMYVEDVPISTLLRGAINGALETLDPYSAYYNDEDFKAFLDTTIEGAFGGVGITVEQKSDYVTVVAPIPGTPADAAGLRAGDQILEVDGKSAKGWSSEAATNVIRGQIGTVVKLKVKKAETGQVVDLEITRAQIKVPTVESQVIENGSIGVIRMYRFTESTATDLDAALRNFKTRGVKAILLDLRDNPGGLVSSSLDVLRQLMPKGPAIHMVGRSGEVTTYSSGTDEKLLPTVVLINGGTASASEIVAGAMKDHASGFIVGTQSFGKGSVQQLVDLPNGEGLKLTTHRYLTPFKNKIDGIGVTPELDLKEETWPDPMKAPPLVESRKYALKDAGPEVAQLERALIALGHLKAPAAGVYTDAVVTAVKQYQTAKSAPVTGYPDAEVIKMLNADLAMKGLGGLDRQTWEAKEILKQKARIGF